MKRFLPFFCMLILLVSCNRTNPTQPITSTSTSTSTGTVQVLYFHGKQRCITCKAIEALTKEVLQNDFKEEMDAKKISFKAVDITENEALANKYEVTFSSLILDKNDTVKNLTDMAFSYAKSEPEKFKAEFKAELSKLL